ncbi:MAG: hypothetical protein KJ648_07640 [Candidatus Omnitrophica bacterium]|nr:hypothetical protein [Candidatus Omnitrophota bacterium]
MRCTHCTKTILVMDNKLTVRRYGGGTYLRPGRWYTSTVCRPCAEELLAHATPGHDLTCRYNVASIKHALGLAP